MKSELSPTRAAALRDSEPDRLIPRHVGYRKLKSFQVQHGRGGQGPRSTESTVSTQSTKPTYATISANGALALIAVACSLLDRQIAAQGRSFVEEGGFTERLYRVRSARTRSWEH